MLLGDDRTLDFVQGLRKTCGDEDIPVVVAQYAITSEQGAAKMRHERLIYHVDRGMLSPLKRYLCRRFPEQLLVFNGSRLMFHTPLTLIALTLRSKRFQNPWAFGGAFSDKALLIDENQLNTALRVGGSIDKYEIVGQASFDRLYDTWRAKKEIKRKIVHSYGLQKKKNLLIFAVPHYAEHKMMSATAFDN